MRYLSLFPVLASLMLAAGGPAGPAPGFRLFDTVETSASYTAAAGLRAGPGEVSVTCYEAAVGGSAILADGSAWTFGLTLGTTGIDAPDRALLPDRLREFALRLGWTRPVGPQWRLLVTARPGFFGDAWTLAGDTFNAPVFALASYAASRELAWSLGLVANPFNDHPVIPIAGLRWRFAPAWTLNLGLPRAGVSWTLNPGVTLSLGATVQGGGYKTTRAPIGATGADAVRLTGTKLDYREIRMGLGAEFALSEAVALAVDAGVTVDQRFDYHQVGLERRGASAAFGRIALTGRF